MAIKKPSHFSPDLSNERLEVIARALLDIRHTTIRELNSKYDSNYSREGTAFERSRNLLIDMCLEKGHDWLRLASSAMDVTFRIGSIPCRFFRDDPESPKKRGFFKRNLVDNLFATDEGEPVMWRFVVERAETDEDEDRVHLIGFNAFQEKVSQWTFGDSIRSLHSVDKEVPVAKSLRPAAVGLLDDEAASDKAVSE